MLNQSVSIGIVQQWAHCLPINRALIGRFYIAAIFFFPLMAIAGSKTDSLQKLEWYIAGKLPSSAGATASLGMAGPIAGVYEDVILVAGGANFPEGMPWRGGKKAFLKEGFIFSRLQNGKLRSETTFDLLQPIAYAASCTTPSGVVIAGGENQDGFSSKAWILRWDKKIKQVRITPLPDLPIETSNGAMAASGNTVYFAGGQAKGGTSDRFFRLNVSVIGKTWEELPRLPVPLAYTVLLTQSNGGSETLYLAGGRSSNPIGISDISKALYCYNIQKQTWEKKKDLPYPLSAGNGVAAGTTYLLLFS